MAITVERFLERFSPKFGKLSIPKTKVDALAANFSSLIADDATDEVIDSFLDTMDKALPFKDIAAEEHRKLTPKPKPEPAPADEPKPTPNPNPDVPAWAQALIDSNKSLSDKLQALEGEKKQTSIKEKASSLFKEKGVPEEFWKFTALPSDEETLTTFVDTVTTGYKEFEQKLTNNSTVTGRPPVGTSGPKAKQASKEEVDAIVANLPNI